jgi:hypothetical protein
LWLPFQEGGGGKVYDMSGHGNDGTLSGFANPATAVSGWTPSKLGKGLSFDGVNDYVSINDLVAYARLSPHTYCAWVKVLGSPGSASGYGWIINNGSSNNGTSLVVYTESDVSNRVAFFSFGGNEVAFSSSVFNWNTWKNICAVYDSSNNVTFYINGVVAGVSAASASSWSALNANPRIGSWYNDAHLFNGIIDDVHIYNGALTAGEVRKLFVDPYGDFKPPSIDYRHAGSAKSAKKTLLIRSNYGREKPPLGVLPDPQHPLQKGIVGQWLMNEGGGITIYDLSGNKNHGTLTNMANPPTASSGWTAGKLGKGLSFDGVNDYVSIPTAGVSKDTGTISFWAKPTSVPSDSYIVTASTSARIIYLRWIGGSIFRFNLGSGATQIGNYTGTINNWYHIVGIWNNGLGSFYVNGVNIANNVAYTALASVQNPMFVGAFSGTSGYFPGLIDDVRIYNRALSAGEVMELYLQPYCMFPKTKISSQMFNTIPQIPRSLLNYGRALIY